MSVRIPRLVPPLVAALLLGVLAARADAQSSTYRFTFPEPEARWMQVELTLEELPSSPLTLRVSRSSPGRYGPQDFARNVFAVEIVDAEGTPLVASHAEADEWRIDRPTSTVRVRYRVAGPRTEGTYSGIDASHAHINMPAALIWVAGLEERPVTVRFTLPEGRGWRIATQLFPGPDAQTFSAPNLQYLMDSPAELSAFTMRAFSMPEGDRQVTFRVAVHHQGTDADVDALTADVARVTAEARGVFGEFPAFETNTYTFIGDYLRGASVDGMEHRNSTVVTSPRSIQTDRKDIVFAISHEFFHAWNVERMRPRSLEPFDFTHPNVSSELWLAEGFTQYYGTLVLARSGLLSPAEFTSEMSELVRQVVANPATRAGSLEDMSRMAAVIDSSTAPSRAGERFLSYYTWGGAVALALDMTLRERSDDRVTLDDFMRALWQRFGKPGGRAPGVVDRPYSTDDVQATLADVSGDARFAREFFDRYIHGHDIPDFDRLLRRPGLAVRQVGAARQGEPQVDVVLTENAGRPVTDEQRRARTAWLGSLARP